MELILEKDRRNMDTIYVNCQNCGTKLMVNGGYAKVKCSRCGVEVLVPNANQSVQNIQGQNTGQYIQENQQPNLQGAADASNNQQIPTKKKHTLLWILGWIFILPLPLTIVLIRNKKITPFVKGVIIVFVWILYLLIVGTRTTRRGTTEPKIEEAAITSSQEKNEDENIEETKKEESKVEEPKTEESKAEKSDPDDALKNELEEKYGISEPHMFARGDNTGRWRVAEVANSTPPSDYALDYANVYMKNAGITDIHYIVNLSLKTTTKMQIIENTLSVTTTEYVDKEQFDATYIGEGMVLSEEYYNIDTGEEIKVDVDENAGTVENDDLVSTVESAIQGSVGEGEEITKVEFDGKNLTVFVDLSNADPKLKSVTLKDIADIRIQSITDSILDLDDSYYNTWETITLDFGDVGKAVLDKSMVKDQGLGKFFDYPEDIIR